MRDLIDDFPEDTYEITSLTAKQAADLVMVVFHVRRYQSILELPGLTSIDKDVAQELAKFKGDLNHHALSVSGLTSIDKEVAKELGKFEGDLNLDGLTSIDKEVLEILKSNPKIYLPYKYRD